MIPTQPFKVTFLRSNKKEITYHPNTLGWMVTEKNGDKDAIASYTIAESQVELEHDYFSSLWQDYDVEYLKGES